MDRAPDQQQHVLKPAAPGHARQYLYTVSEWIDGQTLARWMIDNPITDLDVVRSLIQQIGVGLRAFHRKEMVHQDLRPAKIMIDRRGNGALRHLFSLGHRLPHAHWAFAL